MHLLYVLLSVYMFVLVARAVTSWFPPPSPGSPFAFVTQILRDLTEPLLAPLRRVIPPAGPFDISFLVLFIIIIVIRGFVA